MAGQASRGGGDQNAKDRAVPACPVPLTSPAPQRADAGLSLAASIRRRRDASLRLPPLDSGVRDPLDQVAGLPIRPAQSCHGAEYVGGRWLPCCRSGAA